MCGVYCFKLLSFATENEFKELFLFKQILKCFRLVRSLLLLSQPNGTEREPTEKVLISSGKANL